MNEADTHDSTILKNFTQEVGVAIEDVHRIKGNNPSVRVYDVHAGYPHVTEPNDLILYAKALGKLKPKDLQ